MLLAPRAPSLFSLARSQQLANEAAEQKKRSPSGRRSGLFDALVGEPRTLYYEMLEDPSRFEEGAMDVVLQLVTGQRTNSSLSSTEQSLLDRATLDWARPRHKPSGGAPSVAPERKNEAIEYLTYQELLEDPAVDLVYNEDGSPTPLEAEPLIPAEKPATFWWRS